MKLKVEHEARSKSKHSSKNSDYLVKVISVQISVCAVIFILALTGQRFGKEGFNGIINEYKKLTEKDIAISEIKDAFLGKKEEKEEESTLAAEPSTEAQSLPAPLEDDENSVYSESTGKSAYTVGGEALSPTDLSSRVLATPSVILSSLIKTEPVIPVQDSRISSEFGYRDHPITDERQLHAGTDFGADEGDRIAAVLDGRVIKATYSQARGYHIVIQHDNGMETWYCHCSKLLVKAGTVVRAGETIALVGSTGDSTGPHLHLEVHVDGEPKDPMEVLFKDYDF